MLATSSREDWSHSNVGLKDDLAKARHWRAVARRRRCNQSDSLTIASAYVLARAYIRRARNSMKRI